MTQITGPLFGSSATGAIGDLGHFRRSPHGPQFVDPQDTTARKPHQARPINACLAAAKAAHAAIPPQKVWNGTDWVGRRSPIWNVFWAQWLANHPECRG